MKTSEADILIVPGWLNSGPDHWQSRWERNLKTARRIEQDDWHAPDKRCVGRQHRHSRERGVASGGACRAQPRRHRRRPRGARSCRRARSPAPSSWRRPTSTTRRAGRRTRATRGRRDSFGFAPVPMHKPLPFPSLLLAADGRSLLLAGAGEGFRRRLGFEFCGCRAGRPHRRPVGPWALAGRAPALRQVPRRPQGLTVRPCRPPRCRTRPWPATRPWRRGSRRPTP